MTDRSNDAENDAAVKFRDGLVGRADEMRHGVYPLWHGWALYDAFKAGAAFARSTRATVPLELLGRLQAAAEPYDGDCGDAVIPAALWREFVDAHARALYDAAHSETPRGDTAKDFDHWFALEYGCNDASDGQVAFKRLLRHAWYAALRSNGGSANARDPLAWDATKKML